MRVFIAKVTMKDPDMFQAYAQKAGETFGAHGGKPLLRGKVEASLAGNPEHHAVGVVQFPTMDALMSWHDSPEYQVLIPQRDEAAEVA
jgi:uncharacterized protein (DUF1330 family)